MGTWGEGLYDNDGALDHLAALLSIEDEVQEAVELTARIGLLVWLNPTSLTFGSESLNARVDAASKKLDRLPEESQMALEELFVDPEAVTERRSRKPEAEAVLGGYCDGPQIDALLRFLGSRVSPGPAAPAERYQHPKLGVGVLVGRSGSGEEERFDLRFDNGEIRKILARFVTKLET